MGLLAIWYNDFFGAQTVAVLPYEQYLKRFPAYLQQLTMESNGKHVTLDGTRGRLRDRPDLLGRAGDQRPALLLPADPPGHAAHPLRLHRVRRRRSIRSAGTTTCCWRTSSPRPRRWPSARRPSEVKAEGTPDWLVPHRVFEGNRPSNTILAERLTPEALGKLVALYEHIVFTQGTIWNIDSFDQWGVELGKVLAQRIIPELERGRSSKASRTAARPRQLDEQPDPPLPEAQGRPRPERRIAMQLGMIGLGRMGANMVRRLLKGGHQCVVFDMSPKAVQELAKEKAVGASSLADFVKKLEQAARGLADGPGGRRGQDDRRPPAAARARRHPHRRRQLLLRRRHPPREGARRRRASTTWTWGRAAASGASSAATA